MQDAAHMENLINQIVQQRVNEALQQISNQPQPQQEPEERGEDGWIRASEARETGDRDIPLSLQGSFNIHPMENIFQAQSVKRFLDKHEEPRGGFLKTQHLDYELEVSVQTRKRDEELQEIQREVLSTIKPLITIYESIEQGAEPNQETLRIMETIKRTIEYVNHVGGKIYSSRRRDVLRSLGLKNFEEIVRTPSSSLNHLFGPEIRKEILSQIPKAPALAPKYQGKERGYSGKKSSYSSNRNGKGNSQFQGNSNRQQPNSSYPPSNPPSQQ